MSANVETMFSAHDIVPWHRQGTVIKDAPTVADALKIAGIDWKVVQEPVFTGNGVKIEGYVANVRDVDKYILGIVTPKYRVAQNQDALEFVDELLGGKQGVNVTFETAGSLAHGKRIWLLANIPSRNILGDEIATYLVFGNCHDGTGAITVAVVTVRVVCQNTYNLAIKGAQRIWRTRHLGDFKARIEEASRTLELSTKYLDKSEEKALSLAKIQIGEKRLAQIMDMVFPSNPEEASRRAANNTEVLRSGFLECLNKPDLSNIKKNGWGVFQAFADFATHAKPLRDSKSFEEKRFMSFIDGNKLLFEAQTAIESVA